MAYSVESTTADCYPGTTCLINKLGIQDETILAEKEAAIVFAKASLLDQRPIQGKFDFEHYKQIHRFLFCNLYDWAGQVRTVNIAKKGTAFIPVEEIERCAEACFSRLTAFDSKNLSHHELAAEIADFYHSINMLHPFREGNGRTQRVFFTQWLQHLGYDFNLISIDPDEFMIATIFAAQGVMDPLIHLFEEIIEPLDNIEMTF